MPIKFKFNMMLKYSFIISSFMKNAIMIFNYDSLINRYELYAHESYYKNITIFTISFSRSYSTKNFVLEAFIDFVLNTHANVNKSFAYDPQIRDTRSVNFRCEGMTSDQPLQQNKVSDTRKRLKIVKNKYLPWS